MPVAVSYRKGLVASDRRIDVDRPGVDAAGQVVDVLEALLQEVLGRVLAAAAVVAVEGDRRRLVEGLELRGRGLVEVTRRRDLPSILLLATGLTLPPALRVRPRHPTVTE